MSAVHHRLGAGMIAVAAVTLLAGGPARGVAAAAAGTATGGAGHALGRAQAHLQASQPKLTYFGGTGGVGVQVHPKLYLVFWGSQWGPSSMLGQNLTFANDPANAAPYVQNFVRGLFGSQDTWSTSTNQYCQGVAFGATTCPASAQHVIHPTTSPLAGVWADTGALAPAQATNAQLGQEADAAAVHFGNATPASNSSVQYVVVSPTQTHPGGFNTPSGSFCAWHDFTGAQDINVITPRGNVAFTNLPYITDASVNCGQGFVNTPGLLDGWSIVEGHEYAETVSDFFPQAPVGSSTLTSGGWFEPTRGENGDKCAWITPGTNGGAANITLSTGAFAVQSLWSNNANHNTGGCSIFYKSARNQHG